MNASHYNLAYLFILINKDDIMDILYRSFTILNISIKINSPNSYSILFRKYNLYLNLRG